jgi:hypothetical protein
MNERIRELAEQAEIPVIEGHWDYNDREILVKDDGEWRKALPSEIIHTMFQSEQGLEKFAELIVKECLEQIDKIRDGLEEDNEAEQALGADWAGLAVARHFGVE